MTAERLTEIKTRLFRCQLKVDSVIRRFARAHLLRGDVPDIIEALEAAQERIAVLEVANANLNGHLTHEARLADSNLGAYKEVRGLYDAMRSRADGLEIECERLKQTLRSIVVTCGGIAAPGVSTDFLVSTAEEVRLMKEELLQKLQQLEADKARLNWMEAQMLQQNCWLPGYNKHTRTWFVVDESENEPTFRTALDAARGVPRG